ncbi:beta-N-acetylhexosaminidase [Stackebrandtia albiflava]|uniref:beta-N-acetylhexosaminidase n=1 Tax=Stackebrandtia albiflava TaxID=406432 RepID=A0A562UQS0_9ACTN|nr:glycoside hydrolase family 3 protein [Stackebrandtia albiflava]TWJ07972.1 beta-N-acetylhexosaminidase [Stackebrandtia albiflava]
MRQPVRARLLRLATLLTVLPALVTLTVSPATAHPTGQDVTGSDENRTRAWVEKRLKDMSVEEKVGQLFVTYVYGQTADTTDPADVAANRAAHGVDNAAQLIDEYHLGGVIYFGWSNNLENPHQIAELSNDMQAVATEDDGAPLLVSTDQEQGIVTRFGPPATAFPGNMALGAVRNPWAAGAAAVVTGAELKAVGINQNFAPVADVNVNADNPVIGVRSFSGDPGLAADLTAAQVLGYQGLGGVTATAKHFPGHGDTDEDSHVSLPRITHTWEEWQRLDAPPFEAAIDAGIDSIMTGHIQFPALDDSLLPATLSHDILTGLLREEMGFDGVVVTDSLSMAGVRETYGDDRVPVMALAAGADMLLMPPDIELAFDSVLAAVESGEIGLDRLDGSVRRILTLKHERGIVADPYADLDRIDHVVGNRLHTAVTTVVTEASTTLIRNEAETLPLGADSGGVFVTGWGQSTTASVAQRIADRGVTASSYWAGTSPTDAAVAEAVARSASHDTTVVLTNGAWRNAAQARLVDALIDAGRTVVAVAVGVPYDIATHPGVDASLATYSYTGPALDSLVEVLYGEVNPSGRLPVTVPTAEDPQIPLYEFGHGLRYP